MLRENYIFPETAKRSHILGGRAVRLHLKNQSRATLVGEIDLAVPPDEALPVAYREALRHVLTVTTDIVPCR